MFVVLRDQRDGTKPSRTRVSGTPWKLEGCPMTHHRPGGRRIRGCVAYKGAGLFRAPRQRRRGPASWRNQNSRRKWHAQWLGGLECVGWRDARRMEEQGSFGLATLQRQRSAARRARLGQKFR